MSQTATQPLSPETQRLVDACQTLSREVSPQRWADLRALAAQRQGEMLEALLEYDRQVQEQPPEFRQLFVTSIQAIQYGFATYGEALDAILAATEASQLPEAAEALATASTVLRVAMTGYQERFLSLGSSRFGEINFIEHLAVRYRAGELDHDSWSRTCLSHAQFYTVAIQEIDASPKAHDPSVPERRAAFLELHGVLTRLAGRRPDEEIPVYQADLQAMSQAHMQLEAALSQFSADAFTRGPTESPKANLVIHAARGVLDGSFEPAVLAILASDYLEEIRHGTVDLNRWLAAGTESSVLSEEVPKLRDVLEMMTDYLKTLTDYAVKPGLSKPQMIEYLAGFEQLIVELVRSNEAVQSSLETVGRSVCPDCQTPNDPQAKVCEKCGRALVRLRVGDGPSGRLEVREGGEEEVRHEVITTAMKSLFDDCTAFQYGKFPSEKLLAKIDHYEKTVDESESRLRKLHLPVLPPEATEVQRNEAQPYLALAQDSMELLERGMQACRAGLEGMRMAVQSNDFRLMSEGAQFYYDGIQELWKVEQNAKQLDALVEKATAPFRDAAVEAAADDSASLSVVPEIETEPDIVLG